MPKAKFSCSLCTWLHFHLLCPDSCYLQVCFDMPTAVPAVFLFNSELAFKSFKTLMHAGCRRGMQEITPVIWEVSFPVPHLLQNVFFLKIPKYLKKNKVTPHVALCNLLSISKKAFAPMFSCPSNNCFALTQGDS